MAFVAVLDEHRTDPLFKERELSTLDRRCLFSEGDIRMHADRNQNQYVRTSNALGGDGGGESKNESES